MNRNEFTFEYDAADLRDAAMKQRDHHRTRALSWSDERAKAEKLLKESGVEFRDMPVTGGVRVDAVIDPQKKARLVECEEKTREHEARAAEFDTWVRAFVQAQPGVSYALTIEDVKYFGL